LKKNQSFKKSPTLLSFIGFCIFLVQAGFEKKTQLMAFGVFMIFKLLE